MILDVVSLVDNAFAHPFKESTRATTRGSDIEVNKNVREFSTIMSVLTSKNGDFSSRFDKTSDITLIIQHWKEHWLITKQFKQIKGKYSFN